MVWWLESVFQMQILSLISRLGELGPWATPTEPARSAAHINE